MDFAIFRLFIRVSLFVIALIACIIYLIKKRKLIYSIFFDKEAIKKEYTGKNDIIFLRLANTIPVSYTHLVVRRCIITGNEKGVKEYTILPKAKSG